MPALGFDDSLFNIEFFVHADGPAKIVEVNGRMASQFAPLIRAVHGMSSYRIQLELVDRREAPSPETPDGHGRLELRLAAVHGRRHRRVGPGPAPSSGTVPREPGRAARPAGQRLSDNDDDSASHRLAVVAMSGPDRATLLHDWEDAQRLLSFELREVERAKRASTAR